MHVVNVLSRGLVILVGLGILLGVGPAAGVPQSTRIVFGAVVVLFGIYRLSTYFLAKKRNSL